MISLFPIGPDYQKTKMDDASGRDKFSWGRQKTIPNLPIPTRPPTTIMVQSRRPGPD
jgi:hypothetical protein